MNTQCKFLTMGAAAIGLLGPLSTYALVRETPRAAAAPNDIFLKERAASLDRRLSDARALGRIGSSQYGRVKDELEDVQSETDRLREGHGGQLTGNDAATIASQLETIAEEIHWWTPDFNRQLR